MKKLTFSTTQVLKVPTIVGSIICGGSIFYYRDQNLVFLLSQPVLIAFFIFSIQSVRRFFISQKYTSILGIVVLVLSFVAQFSVNYFLIEYRDYLTLFAFLHGVMVWIIFHNLFNPRILLDLGWSDIDTDEW